MSLYYLYNKHIEKFLMKKKLGNSLILNWEMITVIKILFLVGLILNKIIIHKFWILITYSYWQTNYHIIFQIQLKKYYMME